MEISYTPMDLLLYLLLYSFIGWGIEVCVMRSRTAASSTEAF